MPDRDPISPGGWKMTLFHYKSQEIEPFMLGGAYSLTYCQRMKSIWHDARHDGKSEMLIMPVDGWDSLKGTDPFGAIAWAIAQDLVSIEVGASLIRAVAEEVAGRLPAEGLLGLALYYLRATVKESGGDDEIEQVVDKLNENLHRRVGDVDAPMPF